MEASPEATLAPMEEWSDEIPIIPDHASRARSWRDGSSIWRAELAFESPRWT